MYGFFGQNVCAEVMTDAEQRQYDAIWDARKRERDLPDQFFDLLNSLLEELKAEVAEMNGFTKLVGSISEQQLRQAETLDKFASQILEQVGLNGDFERRLAALEKQLNSRNPARV
jgi:hypothetical protein